MKLKATGDKATLKWFAILSDGSRVRNNQGFIHNAWDVECSCGWRTLTGGAIKSYIADKVFDHKRYDHGYKIMDDYGDYTALVGYLIQQDIK